MARTRWCLHSPLRLAAAMAVLLLAGGCGSCQQTTEAPVTSGSAAEEGKPRVETAPATPQSGGKPTVAAGAPAAAEPPDEADDSETGGCTVIIDADPDYGAPPLSVHFSVDADCGGGTPAYDWNFGDGSPHATEASPVHVYQKDGDYTVTLKAVGADGSTGSDEIDVTAEADDAP